MSCSDVTPLAALYGMYDASSKLIEGKGQRAEALQSLETNSAALPVVDMPKTLKVKGKRRDNLVAYQPQKIAELIAKLQKSAAKRKSDRKEIEHLCRELLAEINPQVRLALTGIVYAYYFSPDDLLISEDPLFLRKHEFVDLEPVGHPDLFGHAPELEVSSEGAGSYLTGRIRRIQHGSGAGGRPRVRRPATPKWWSHRKSARCARPAGERSPMTTCCCSV